MTTEPKFYNLSAVAEIVKPLRDPAWKGLGVAVAPHTPIQDALRQAGLDWEVGLKPVYYGDTTGETGLPVYRPVPNRVAVVRKTDGRAYGVVSPQYHPVQNLQAGEFAESLQEGADIQLVAAGSFHQGAHIWMQMQLPHVAFIAGLDPVKSMLTIVNGHDGGLGFRTFWTKVRISCENSMMRAISTAKAIISLRHAGTIMERLQEAREVLGFTQDKFGEWIQEAERLVRYSFLKHEMDEFLEKVLEIDPALPRDKQPRKFNAKDRIEELVEVGAGLQTPGIKGTKYALAQAVNEFVDHERSTNPDRRVYSAWFGQGAELKDRVWKSLLEGVN